MRFAAAILLFATCFFVGTDCYSQDPCSRTVRPKPDEKPLTSAEIVHHVLLNNSLEQRRHLTLSDVVFMLRCGTQQDAAEFFVAIRDTSVQVPDATVVEANQDFVRVSWDDGFKPNLVAFTFKFDKPLNAIPQPGDKIQIRGTYSSYSREPFQINMTNSSFVLLPPPAINTQSRIRHCYSNPHPALIPHSSPPFLFSLKADPQIPSVYAPIPRPQTIFHAFTQQNRMSSPGLAKNP